MRNSMSKIVACVLASVIIFVLGMFAQYSKIHMYIPGGRYLADYLFGMVYDNNFYYKAYGNNGQELFDITGVKYPFEFIVAGDLQEPATIEKEYLIDKIIDEKPDFVLLAGDMVQSGNEHQWNIFDNYVGQIMRSGISVYPTLGNHEYYDINALYVDDPEINLKLYFERFPKLNGNKWYSFKYGNSRFLILDTNTEFNVASEQYEWFKTEMMKKDAKNIIVMFHHPPYSKGGHKRRVVEKHVAELIDNYVDNGVAQVDFVFSGHVHNYERYEKNRINYIVTGGGGAMDHKVRRDGGDFYNKEGATYHYCKVRVDADKITFQMIRLDGGKKEWIVDDELIIEKL